MNTHAVPSERPPLYALRRDLGVWQLTFNGHRAILKHEQGIYYVAFLLAHPNAEPIHGLALALMSEPGSNCAGSMAQLADPATSQLISLNHRCAPGEWNLQLDEARAAWALRRHQLELEAVLDDPAQSEPVKAEVLHELESIYAYQKAHLGRTATAAQRAVRTVRMAIKRFHDRLRAAVDRDGRPHPVLQSFGVHLEKYLLLPSARYSGVRSRARTGLCGRFTYEPPPGVRWEEEL